MRFNGRGPMDRGQGMGRQLGYCYGYRNNNNNFENQTREDSLGKKFVQGFEQDVNYTEKELLNLRKISLQGELEIIEEKLKNL